MTSHDETDWEFQRDVKQLAEAVRATDAMLKKVLEVVRERVEGAESEARNAGDIEAFHHIVDMTKMVEEQFAVFRGSFDGLQGFLTRVPGRDAGDLGECPQ